MVLFQVVSVALEKTVDTRDRKTIIRTAAAVIVIFLQTNVAPLPSNDGSRIPPRRYPTKLFHVQRTDRGRMMMTSSPQVACFF